MPPRVYQLRRDWGAQPHFTGTAEEIASHLKDTGGNARLNLAGKWGTHVVELPDGVSTRPKTAWLGIINGEKVWVDGEWRIGKVRVTHGAHDAAWFTDLGLPDKWNAMSVAARMPKITRTVLRMPVEERMKLWAERREKTKERSKPYIEGLKQRDELSNERVDDLATAFRDLGVLTSNIGIDTVDESLVSGFTKSPAWYEMELSGHLQRENLRALMDHPDREGASWIKGYVMRPDGSYALGKITRTQLARMVKTNDFSPPKRRAARPRPRPPAEFTTRRML